MSQSPLATCKTEISHRLAMKLFLYLYGMNYAQKFIQNPLY